MNVVLWPAASTTVCDHGINLLCDCAACARVEFWRFVVVRLAIMGACMAAIGVILIWIH